MIGAKVAIFSSVILMAFLASLFFINPALLLSSLNRLAAKTKTAVPATAPVAPAAPTVSNFSAERGAYCTGVPGIGIAYFSWDYSDANCDKEKYFKFQVASHFKVVDGKTVGDYESFVPEINYTSPNLYLDSCLNGKNSVKNVQSPLITVSQATRNAPLIYNQKYYFRVSVYDSTGRTSGWVDGGDFTMTGHPAPSPNFRPSPESNSTVPADINFMDLSYCYKNNDPVKYSCSSADITAEYTWDTGEDTDLTKGSMSYTYDQKGTYRAQLMICDDGCANGSCCCTSPVQAIPIGTDERNNIPDWSEISPF